MSVSSVRRRPHVDSNNNQESQLFSEFKAFINNDNAPSLSRANVEKIAKLFEYTVEENLDSSQITDTTSQTADISSQTPTLGAFQENLTDLVNESLADSTQRTNLLNFIENPTFTEHETTFDYIAQLHFPKGITLIVADKSLAFEFLFFVCLHKLILEYEFAEGSTIDEQNVYEYLISFVQLQLIYTLSLIEIDKQQKNVQYLYKLGSSPHKFKNIDFDLTYINFSGFGEVSFTYTWARGNRSFVDNDAEHQTLKGSERHMSLELNGTSKFISENTDFFGGVHLKIIKQHQNQYSLNSPNNHAKETLRDRVTVNKHDNFVTNTSDYSLLRDAISPFGERINHKIAKFFKKLKELFDKQKSQPLNFRTFLSEYITARAKLRKTQETSQSTNSIKIPMLWLREFEFLPQKAKVTNLYISIGASAGWNIMSVGAERTSDDIKIKPRRLNPISKISDVHRLAIYLKQDIKISNKQLRKIFPNVFTQAQDENESITPDQIAQTDFTKRQEYGQLCIEINSANNDYDIYSRKLDKFILKCSNNIFHRFLKEQL